MNRNDNGQFTKGNPGGGRPKGSTNKATAEIRADFKKLIDDNLPQLESDLKTLDPKDRLEMILKMAKFVLPSLKSTELKTSGEPPINIIDLGNGKPLEDE